MSGWGWNEPQRSCSKSPLLKTVSAKAGCSGLCWVRFWISPRMQTLQPLWASHFTLGFFFWRRELQPCFLQNTPLRILIFTISWSWQPSYRLTFTSLTSSSFFVSAGTLLYSTSETHPLLISKKGVRASTIILSSWHFIIHVHAVDLSKS